uniref:BRO1 domain-containing protein n=1 Tax=Syphacia muris TaxID=451379 RepID=A0A0N5B0B1_9BILA
MNMSRFSLVSFDSNLLTWLVSLMLAQAQECILEKSLIDHRKSIIVAKIATYLKETYKDCAEKLRNSCVCMSLVFRHYNTILLYDAISLIFLGDKAEEDQKMGTRLLFYELAGKHVTTALKFSEKDKRERIFRITTAKKDNDFIYHDRIPNVEELSFVEGVTMVKPIPFDPTDRSVSGDDLFAALLPMNVLKAVSVYSEEKAKFKREVTEKIRVKDEELEYAIIFFNHCLFTVLYISCFGTLQLLFRNYLLSAHLKKLLVKVEEMREQRKKLFDELCIDLENDDITAKCLDEKEFDNNELFKNELAKHTKIMKIIEMNLTAQTNILGALTEVNASLATYRRKMIDIKSRRKEQILALTVAYEVYCNVLQKANEGLKFYTTLNGMVKTLTGASLKIFCTTKQHKLSSFFKGSLEFCLGNTLSQLSSVSNFQPAVAPYNVLMKAPQELTTKVQQYGTIVNKSYNIAPQPPVISSSQVFFCSICGNIFNFIRRDFMV